MLLDYLDILITLLDSTKFHKILWSRRKLSE